MNEGSWVAHRPWWRDPKLKSAAVLVVVVVVVLGVSVLLKTADEPFLLRATERDLAACDAVEAFTSDSDTHTLREELMAEHLIMFLLAADDPRLRDIGEQMYEVEAPWLMDPTLEGVGDTLLNAVHGVKALEVCGRL